MLEKKFLAYVLYVTLLEIREDAYEKNDSRRYHLADMLHNVPFSLLDNELAKGEYENLLKSVEALQVPDWLNRKMSDFKEIFPEFK